ncbi:unnamed protein product [Lymnaea stagnalis]|uniref:SUN domain-containing protein n=1 Tax=Lymnaea stagnalis TaxID=6523 RepID=A0AAV2HB67_LYMST
MSSFTNITYAIPIKPHGLGGDYINRNGRSRPGEADHTINSLTPLIMAADSAASSYFDANEGGYMAPDVPIQLDGKSNGVVSFPQKKPRSCGKQNGMGVDTSADTTEERRYRGLSLTNANGAPLSTRGVTNSLSQDEDYENDPSSYLTPKDPPSYERTFAYDSTVGGVDGGHGVTDVKTSRVPFKRFDSGVEDCVPDRGSNSTTLSNSLSETYHFMASPRLSTAPEQHYEDIDMYSKNKASASQPKPRSSIDKFSMNNGTAGNMNSRPLPQVNSSATRSLSDSEDHQLILETSIAETVSHPLTQPELRHNSLAMTLPHTYSQLMSHTNNYTLKEMPQETPRSHCRFIAALVFIFITSAMALSLSIYVLINSPGQSVSSERPSHPSIHAEDLKQNLSRLQQEMVSLKEENKYLKDQLEAQKNNTWFIENKYLKDQLEAQKNNTWFIENKYLKDQMEAQKNNTWFIESLQQEIGQLSSQQRNMMLNISQEIANISLTPGPQGHPGVVNFSMCRNESSQHVAVASPVLGIETDYIPEGDKVKDNFVIFAYCTYTPGTNGMLEMSPHGDQYRCVCQGQAKNKTHSHCSIFIWVCPKIT